MRYKVTNVGVAVFFILFIFVVCHIEVRAEAKVLSDITADTVLEENTEYILDYDISIKNGVTLTIPRGVVIYGNNYGITNYGGIEIIGSTLYDVKLIGRDLEYAPFTFTMKECMMFGGQLLPATGHSQHGYITLEKNIFHGLNDYSYIWYPYEFNIRDNVFDNCGGISLGVTYSVDISNNIFRQCDTGGYVIEIWNANDEQVVIRNNSFYDTGTVIKLKYSPGNVEAGENYWNTLNIEEIGMRIIDGNKDFSVPGIVNYLPIRETPSWETSEIVHVWDQHKLLTEATCVEDGEVEYKCQYCEETSIEFASPTGVHDYIEEIFPPSTTAKGYTQHSCKNCEDYYIDSYIDMIPIKIEFDSNGGKEPSKSSIQCVYESAYETLPTCTRTGYKFKGWYTKKDGGTKITKSTIVTADQDHILYAQWEAKTYKISFSANGGSVKTKSKTVTYDSTYKTLPSPVRSKYTFKGWYTKKSGGTKVTKSSKVATTKDQTLYAQWTKVSVKKTTVSKLTSPKSKQAKVTLKKLAGVKGYQIEYSKKKSFKDSKKMAVTKTSTILKNLSKGKTYYVRVRGYKLDSKGNRVYGSWSAAKNIKVKK